eukprot:4624487-Pleurochrysis_carterae.AAC.1
MAPRPAWWLARGAPTAPAAPRATTRARPKEEAKPTAAGHATRSRSAAAGAQTAGSHAEVLQRAATRATAARRVQAKAVGLQLKVGALTERRDDEWLQGEPTAEQ